MFAGTCVFFYWNALLPLGARAAYRMMCVSWGHVTIRFVKIVTNTQQLNRTHGHHDSWPRDEWYTHRRGHTFCRYKLYFE